MIGHVDRRIGWYVFHALDRMQFLVLVTERPVVPGKIEAGGDRNDGERCEAGKGSAPKFAPALSQSRLLLAFEARVDAVRHGLFPVRK